MANNQFLLRRMNVHLEEMAVISSLSVVTLLMEKFRGVQKNVTRFSDFFLFYQYDFVAGLWQGFMINAHESGSNSPGRGLLAGM